MCGIAGFHFPARPLPDEAEQILLEMIERIEHRGPDGFGVYLGSNTGLANARLSIIDISGGNQPISNEDESIWLVFNGEIYNFRELRAALQTYGHRFKTATDTEVLVHLYEQYGKRGLSLLNGQFAFALYDSRRRELFAGRDRFGVRPFYYFYDGQLFAFASEVKALAPALAATSAGSLSFDFQSLNSLLKFWTPIPPRTIYKGILELLPAHCLILSQGKDLRLEKYWEPTVSSVKQPNSEERALQMLDELLVDSVRIRSFADVPVASYLSGGLDSAITTALLRKSAPGLETFSLSFQEKLFDESSYQAAAVRALGVKHHNITIANDDIPRHFKDAIRHIETPLLRSSAVPLYLLSGLVRRHGIKVVLTGEGADEVFGGYNIFKEALIKKFWSKNPQSRLRPLLLAKLYPYVKNFSAMRHSDLALFFGYRLADVENPFFSHLLRWKNTARLRQFLLPELREDFDETAAEAGIMALLPPGFAAYSMLDRAQLLEMALFMSNYLLSAQGDRVSMAHSVEGRYPFLDHRLVEFGLNLPTGLRIRGLNEKYLLKKYAAGFLPKPISSRKKHPYRAPILPLVKGPASAELREYLSEQSLRASGIFAEKAVKKLLKRINSSGGASETESMALTAVLSTQCLVDLTREFRVRKQPAFRSAPVKVCRDRQSVPVGGSV